MTEGKGHGLGVCLGLAAVLFATSLHAGGPNIVEVGGRVFKWNPAVPVNFILDQGPLGQLSNEEAAELVRQAVQAWQAVPTASLQFKDLGFLDRDVDAGNFNEFFGKNGPGPEKQLPENPVVFDSDGKITDLLLGEGSSQSVLGFAGVRFLNQQQGHFISAFTVLNGVQASKFGTFPQVITHEFGHLLGLDHTQGLPENTRGCNNPFGAPQSCQFIPLMYPFVFEAGPGKPIRDDEAWISWMYPKENFRTSTGTIRGRVLRRSGGPLAGANVVAVQVSVNSDGSLQESRSEFVSVVSDFLLTDDGAYELPGLTPGSYVVFIQPLLTEFVGGSSVGPFDTRFTGFPKDYYNQGEGGTSADDPTEKLVIQVGAGQTVQGIDLVANETVARIDNDLLSELTDDDEMIFEFPPGFLFPFYGESYSEVVVNSDGNLTFGIGDAGPGVPRTEARFLSGPPRIAPLFTDLDPGQGGQVKAFQEGPSSVTFQWDGVPEFADPPGGAPPNRFSVTLFRNGNILFRYETVAVTPDPDAGLQAVVGIAPGGASSGTPTDLSQAPSQFPVGNTALYQVFPGQSFNLQGKEVFFRASTSELYFPFYRGDAQNFTGFAVTNYSSAEGRLTVEGLNFSGARLPFPENPRGTQVRAGGQLAQLGSEFFGIPLAQGQNGWVRILSSTPELASFFLFGNGLAGPLSKMDGSVAWTEASSVLYFTRVFHGTASLPVPLGGALDAQTRLNVANPGNQDVTVEFRLFNAQGQPLSDAVVRSLPPLGLISESLGALFGLSTPLSDGHVKVVASGGPVVGFELIELADTLLGFNASPGNPETVSYSAQLANGVAGGVAVFTSLKLVNVAAEPRSVTLTAFREDGTVLGVFGPFFLGPNASFQRSVQQIFGLGPVTEASTVGSIRVEAGGDGVIGDVIFGDPVVLNFAAALPLQTRRFRRALFSQVSNGSIDPSDPSMDTFTGVALFNPNPEAAQVHIRVFDPEGTQVGEATLKLPPQGRLSELVETLVPSSRDLIQGYIEIESDQPLVAQELFGNRTLTFLAAVPPTVVE